MFLESKNLDNETKTKIEPINKKINKTFELIPFDE